MNGDHHLNGEDERRPARLTAYALDQLDSAERAEVEAELAASGEARQTVEVLRALSGRMRETGGREPQPEPSPTLREAIEKRLAELETQSAAAPRNKNMTPRRRNRLATLAAAAACLAALAVPVYQWTTPKKPHDDRTLAMRVMPDAREDSPATPTLRSGNPTAGCQTITGGLLGSSSDGVLQYSAGGVTLAGAAMNPQTLTLGTGDSIGVQVTGGGVLSVTNPISLAASNSQTIVLGAGEGLATTRPEAITLTKTGSGVLTLAGTVTTTGSGALTLAANNTFTGGICGNAGRLYPAPGSSLAAPEPADSSRTNTLVYGASGGNVVLSAGTLDVNGYSPNFNGLSGAGTVDSALVPYVATAPKGTAAGITKSGLSVATLADAGGTSTFGGVLRGGTLTGSGASNITAGTLTIDGTPPASSPPAPGTEQYDKIAEEGLREVAKEPLSTFSIDVDTASYANVRRFLQQGALPPADAVRIEEFINYFPYHDPAPHGETPFSVNMEVAACPWNAEHRLVRVGLKGREIDRNERGRSNLVFLLDVSGSMDEPDKLPLVKQAMKMLVQQLGENDRVTIVTYADDTALALKPTNASRKRAIDDCIDALTANGSTNGGEGIKLAYRQARENFIQGGNNRVIMATDGDLNVGITSDDDLVRLIRQQAGSGVFLTLLGVGTGNLKDSKMQKLADRGNGFYYYLDSLREARKVLVEQISGSTVAIAKDVKIQVEFNPSEVAAYRLVGYEKRRLANHDFDNDKKDAGEIGAGHAVTALYELVPAGENPLQGVPRPLKYQRVPDRNLTEAAHSGEILTLRLRYKEPQGKESRLAEFALKDSREPPARASADFRFAAAVASFGMLLRGSPSAGAASFTSVEEMASSALDDDPGGYRAEFLDLVRKAKQLRPRKE